MSTSLEVQKSVYLNHKYEIVFSGVPSKMGAENIQACANDAIRHLQAFDEYQRASASSLDSESMGALRNIELQAREDLFFNLNEKGIRIVKLNNLSEYKSTTSD